MSDPSGPLAAVEQIEQFGDDHLSDGQVEEVVIKYKQAASACAMVLIETSSHEQQAALNDALSRIVEKGRAAWRELPASQRVSIGDVRFGQTMVDRAIADGDLPLAGYLSIEYGRMLLAEGDAERAETAFRQAVTLAREVDADDPELVLLAYVTLLTALGPTEEALSLANELSLAMIGRKELYHPMRAANAVCIRAVLELNYSLTHPARGRVVTRPRRVVRAPGIALHAGRARARFTATHAMAVGLTDHSGGDCRCTPWFRPT